MEVYFNSFNKKLSTEQKYWYIMTARIQKSKMYREYPSTVEECFMASVKGALWTAELLEECRVHVAPELVRIVVAIDPSTTNNKDSDETGIIVAGIDDVGHGYVLADLSGVHSPLEWVKIAVEAYYEYGADRIVAEVNQGGDLVEMALRSYDNNVSYRAVRASKGKYSRAEPVASLYERYMVHHVGRFPMLENQQITFTPQSSKSPDRYDAMVYAITDLMLGRKFHGARIEMI